MTVWDWLSTAGGIELTHALILLVTAVAAYVSYLAHRTAKTNSYLLNHHLDEHIMALSEPTPPPLSTPPPEA